MKKLAVMLGLLALTACAAPEQAPTAVKVGKPYTIAGETYTPEHDPYYDEKGIASWYGPGFHGNKTANGERFDTEAMTAAHPTLPMPSIVRVTNLENGREVTVRVNDRGPFKPGRIIDLSRAAARKLDIHGIEKVRVQYLKAETEQYWAENGLNTKSVRFAKNSPVPKIVPQIDEADAPELAQADEQEPTQESTATVLSVSSNDIPPPQQGRRAKTSDFTLVRSAHAQTPKNVGGDAQVSTVYETLDDEAAPNLEAKKEGGYFVQAGAFSNRENADKLLHRLSEVDAAQVVKNENSALYRVLLGPADSKEAAEALRQKTKSLGIADARVVSR